MANLDRRTFLRLMGVPAVAAALPQSLDTTLAIPADTSLIRFLEARFARGKPDLVVTVQGDADLEYRYAGHLENGRASISDPGMGGLV